MPEIRRQGFVSFRRTGLEPILIRPDNLQEWIVPEHPIHPAYEYLSFTGRGDYLQAYLMYHHGGGYSDIKPQSGSWLPTVDKVLQSSRLMGAGYRELRGGIPRLQRSVIDGKAYLLSRPVPELVAKITTHAMRRFYRLMIGNGSCYFKPKTLYAKLWLRHVERRLDMMLPALMKHPAQGPRDRQGEASGYPLPWAFLCGEVNSPLSLAFCWALSRDLPPPEFVNYR
jgi:hypothetical protein